jgi:hypothetical protein
MWQPRHILLPFRWPSAKCRILTQQLLQSEGSDANGGTTKKETAIYGKWIHTCFSRCVKSELGNSIGFRSLVCCLYQDALMYDGCEVAICNHVKNSVMTPALMSIRMVEKSIGTKRSHHN